MSGSNYTVIARKWRPKSFVELVGQEHIVRTLKNAIEINRIAHAYLFVGPRGTGKTTTARLLAQALNCEEGPSVEFDTSSAICRSIASSSCMDVMEIDGASNNSVDQIRDLRDDCQYAPTQCRFKIYIIDEVHMLSTAAFNALLKTLEEPPEHVKFIFATTESHKVLPTITSRCQRFEFRPIANEVIVSKLTFICKSEGIQATEGALEAVARLAQGGMRDAQSILDQLIAFCGKTLNESHVVQVYGLINQDTLSSLYESIIEAKYAQILDLSEQLVKTGCNLYRALLDLQNLIHEKMITSIKGTRSSLDSHYFIALLEVFQMGLEGIKTSYCERSFFEWILFKAAQQIQEKPIGALIEGLVKIAEKEESDMPSESASALSDSTQELLKRKLGAQDKGLVSCNFKNLT